MAVHVDLRQLEVLMNQWTRRILGLLEELQAIGVDVRVSVGVRMADETGPARGEIVVRISPGQE